jgi:hypothetical protein
MVAVIGPAQRGRWVLPRHNPYTLPSCCTTDLQILSVTRWEELPHPSCERDRTCQATGIQDAIPDD